MPTFDQLSSRPKFSIRKISIIWLQHKVSTWQRYVAVFLWLGAPTRAYRELHACTVSNREKSGCQGERVNRYIVLMAGELVEREVYHATWGYMQARVADPWHTDPDPRIHISDWWILLFSIMIFKMATKRFFSYYLSYWSYIYIIFQRKKVIKKSQNSRNQGFSYYSCLIEGSGSGAGSEAGSVHRGSESGRPKNIRIRIRIEIKMNGEGKEGC